MTASNTKECFKDCVGLRVIGALFGALPNDRSDLSSGNNTLVFEDGTGLTIAQNGSFWRETKQEIDRAISRHLTNLRDTKKEIEDLLAIAGRKL